jgi:hypothetical protein
MVDTDMGKTCLCNRVYFFLRYYSSLEVASEYFRSGADKISIGSDVVFAAEAFLQTGVCLCFVSCIMFSYFAII